MISFELKISVENIVRTNPTVSKSECFCEVYLRDIEKNKWEFFKSTERVVEIELKNVEWCKSIIFKHDQSSKNLPVFFFRVFYSEFEKIGGAQIGFKALQDAKNSVVQNLTESSKVSDKMGEIKVNMSALPSNTVIENEKQFSISYKKNKSGKVDIFLESNPFFILHARMKDCGKYSKVFQSKVSYGKPWNDVKLEEYNFYRPLLMRIYEIVGSKIILLGFCELEMKKEDSVGEFLLFASEDKKKEIGKIKVNVIENVNMDDGKDSLFFSNMSFTNPLLTESPEIPKKSQAQNVINTVKKEEEVLDFLTKRKSKIFQFKIDDLESFTGSDENEGNVSNVSHLPKKKLPKTDGEKLNFAIRNGDLNEFKKRFRMLKNSSRLNKKDKQGYRAIEYVLMGQKEVHYKMLEMILVSNPKLNLKKVVNIVESISFKKLNLFLDEELPYRNRMMKIILYKCMMNEDFDKFKEYISSYGHLLRPNILNEKIDGFSDNLIHYSLRSCEAGNKDDLKYFKHLVDNCKGIRLNDKNYFGDSALSICLHLRFYKLFLHLLLKFNVDLGVDGKEKYVVNQKSYCNILYYLLEQEENDEIMAVVSEVLKRHPNLRDAEEKHDFFSINPLQLCIKRKSKRFLKELLSLPHVRLDHLVSAFKESFKYNFYEGIQMLLSYKDFNRIDLRDKLVFLKDVACINSEEGRLIFKKMLKVENFINLNIFYENKTVLDMVLKKRNVCEENILELIKNGADVQKINDKKINIFHYCAKNNFNKLFKYYVEKCPKKSKRMKEINEEGHSILMICAKNNSEEMFIELMTSHQCDMNYVNENTSETVLTLACKEGHYNIVKVMLPMTNKIINIGKIAPIAIAASNRHFRIVDVLLGLPMRFHNKKSLHNALYYTVVNGDFEMYKKFLKKGARLNYFSMHDLKKPYQLDFIENLIDNGIISLYGKSSGSNYNNSSMKGNIVIRCSQKGNEEEIKLLKFLLKRGYDLSNEVDQYGNNALHMATMREKKEVVNLLLDKIPKLLINKNNKKTYACELCHDLIPVYKSFYEKVKEKKEKLEKEKRRFLEIKLLCSATKVDKKDKFGKSDPYYVFLDCSRKKLFKSHYIKRTLDPKWKLQTFLLNEKVESVTIDTRLICEVWDDDKISSDDFIGSFEFCFREVMNGEKADFDLINVDLMKENDEYLNSGVFHFQKFDYSDIIKGGKSSKYKESLEILKTKMYLPRYTPQ